MSVPVGEKEYFDKLVAEQADFNPFNDRGWAALRSAFLQVAGCKESAAASLDLLDVGCGTGQSLQLYADVARSYIGIDLSSIAINAAASRFPDRQWTVADATHLPFRDNQFDVVAFSSVLHHIPNYVEALREALRVLRPSGQVFAYDPNLLHPAMALIRWPKSPFYSCKGVSPNESPLLPAGLRRRFADAGFEDIRQRCKAGVTYRSIAPPLLRPFLGIYNVIDRTLDWTGIGRWFGTFVLTAARKPATG